MGGFRIALPKVDNCNWLYEPFDSFFFWAKMVTVISHSLKRSCVAPNQLGNDTCSKHAQPRVEFTLCGSHHVPDLQIRSPLVMNWEWVPGMVRMPFILLVLNTRRSMIRPPTNVERFVPVSGYRGFCDSVTITNRAISASGFKLGRSPSTTTQDGHIWLKVQLGSLFAQLDEDGHSSESGRMLDEETHSFRNTSLLAPESAYLEALSIDPDQMPSPIKIAVRYDV
jgi:hypothetical protein